MAVSYAGSTITVSGTETLSGPIDIQSVQNSATTSFSIAKASGTVMLSGGVGAGAILPAHIRSAGSIIVTVTGGSITLHLRVQSER